MRRSVVAWIDLVEVLVQSAEERYPGAAMPGRVVSRARDDELMSLLERRFGNYGRLAINRTGSRAWRLRLAVDEWAYHYEEGVVIILARAGKVFARV